MKCFTDAEAAALQLAAARYHKLLHYVRHPELVDEARMRVAEAAIVGSAKTVDELTDEQFGQVIDLFPEPPP